ncbi:MAG TPA: hypothetical protein VEJ63_12040 [Planctomycetota bacterium]|nr:hypothetical protein [Planctomycetota bacterium]
MHYATDGSDDFFNRLPPEVQQQVLAEMEQRAARAEAYRVRLRERCIRAALYSASAVFVLALMNMGIGWGAVLAMSCCAAGMGAAVSHYKLCHLAAMLLFGVNGIVWTLNGPMSTGGGAAGAGAITFSLWIMHIFLGLMIARWQAGIRMNEDTF